MRLIPGFLVSIVILTGLSALAGWIFQVPFLAGFGAPVPMAPSTALLFLLFGILIISRKQIAGSPFLNRVQIYLGYIGVLLAMILLVLSYMGIHPSIEHLGLPIANQNEIVPLGHISPYSAFLFVLSGSAFLLIISAKNGLIQKAMAAFILASIIVLSGFVLLIAYHMGSPLLYGSAFIPPALSTSVSFTSLGIVLLIDASRILWTFSLPVERADKRTLYYLIGTFIFLSGGIVMAGYYYYRNYEQRYETQIERQLSAIADLKVGQIIKWKNERHADAFDLFNNIAFSALVEEFIQKGKVAPYQTLSQWLRHIQLANNYDRIRLLDITGKTLIKVPEIADPSQYIRKQWISEAVTGKKIFFHDLYRDTVDGRIYMNVFIPILGDQGPIGVLGIIELRIDPWEYLYPMIDNWPFPTITAENLIVRREGDDVLFLSEMRFMKNTALLLRNPLSDTTIFSVKAIKGEGGIFEGIDYQGEHVIGYSSPVKGTPWHLISKINKAEVYSQVRNRFWGTVIFIGALLICFGTIIAYAWSKQQNKNYKEKYETQRALNASIEKFIKAFHTKSVFMSIMQTNGIFLEVNDFVLPFLGFRPEEIIGKNPEILGLFADADTMLRIGENMHQHGFIHNMEVRLKSRDGQIRFGNMSVEILESQKDIYWLAVMTDVTSFKEAQAKVQKLNRVYAVLSDINESIVRIRDPKELYFKACRIAVEKGKLPLTWIGLLDDNSGKLIPVAYAGRSLGYLDKISFSIHDKPCEACPIDSAIRDGNYHGCNISNRGSEIQPCRMIAASYDFKSVISFPLKVSGKIKGTVNFYANEQDFFNDEEIRLLQELSGDISFFMEFNEKEIERVKMGEEMQKMNILLEERVKERTAELNFINKELESFSYSVSHDLRTPLRAISGFAAILQEDFVSGLDPEGLHLLTGIRNNAKRMDQLINDILAISKISRKEINIQQIDMKAQVFSVFQELTDKVPVQKIRFSVDELPDIYADPVLTKQIWTNLISNAIKYTSKKESPQIEISGKSENGKIVYMIRDNGAGFNQEYSGKLFNLFQRLHHQEEFEGTGVGLAIVKRIVHRFGGEVFAKGNPGKGAVFCFSLPALNNIS